MHRDRFGVEPICKVLQFAPSTYYAAKRRPPCDRRLRDRELVVEIHRVFSENYSVYGARKVWRQLNREGIVVARCTVERLMRQEGLAGRVRGAAHRTTTPAVGVRAEDLVERRFAAQRPNQLWIADITYVATWSGFAYTSFIIDVFSRRIVGWRVWNRLKADLALDALEMAIWSRNENLDGLVHHSDRGSQPRFNRSTQHCCFRQRLGGGRVLRRVSSTRGSCGVAC
jgi:putative transposase